MAGEEVTIAQICGQCREKIGTFKVKKENLMLSSKQLIWCPKCQAHTPEVRDVAGRLASIPQEIETYPKAKPAHSSRDSRAER